MGGDGKGGERGDDDNVSVSFTSGWMTLYKSVY
jgi:hypothetical protein